MAHRIINFNAGPSTLPLDVLKTVQEELLDYRGTGMSVMELSHRSPEYDEINESAITLARDLMGLDNKYHVMFCTGGASTQFAMIPLNFVGKGKKGAYVDTGTWSTKAIKEANILGEAHLAGSSKDNEFRHVPKAGDLDVPAGSPYLHITTNNTIKGTQYHYTPEFNGIPLIADMSSDIFSRRLDYSKFAMVYAGSQKNLGPAGTCLVIMHDDLLQKCKDGNPAMWDYRTHATKKSLYNTPPSLTIYIVKLVLEWIKNQGGLAAVEKVNKAKYDKVYGLMEQYPDFFKGTAQVDSRSWMNVTMRLPNEDLEKKLIADAKAAGFGGLKGHRSVGGIRISMYNAMTLEGVEKVLGFMDEFRKANS
jgi:phosphoserine aminotransferase